MRNEQAMRSRVLLWTTLIKRVRLHSPPSRALGSPISGSMSDAKHARGACAGGRVCTAAAAAAFFLSWLVGVLLQKEKSGKDRDDLFFFFLRRKFCPNKLAGGRTHHVKKVVWSSCEDGWTAGEGLVLDWSNRLPDFFSLVFADNEDSVLCFWEGGLSAHNVVRSGEPPWRLRVGPCLGRALALLKLESTKSPQ